MTVVKPIANYILVEPIANESKTEAGIIIPNAQNIKKATVRGKVLAIGPDVQFVKVGNIVVHGRWMGDKTKIGDKEQLLIQEKDILAIED